ncbi:GNAT family N-acetyltransferase [Paenibacillus sp. SYP-B4298]|uniref:GNAT family N-acetyltransferase n=1 Tax=Paenibacillus sp. SYP-B4298 TaxID=2996034 RepID=UPI0022DD35B8|nr:GNAT family N-acetyltransferase [Paenibacillus sp. SYP-B4298]
MTTIIRLAPHETHPYLPFTYKSWRPAVAGQTPISSGRQLITIGAHSNGMPAGLIVGLINGREAAIISIFVVESQRSKGIGTALMNELLTALAECGVASVELWYHALRHASSLEGVISRTGWEAPRLYSTHYRFPLQRLLQAEWMQRLRSRLSRDYTIVPWDASHMEQCLSLPLDEEQAYKSYYSPAEAASVIYQPASFALLKNEHLIGWSVVTRELEDTLLYRTLYIRQAHRRLGLGIALAIRTANAGAQTGIPYGVIQVVDSNNGMKSITERMILSLEPTRTEYRYTTMQLSPKIPLLYT